MPRILVCTVDAWNSRIAANTSSTYSALLSQNDPKELACLYIREEFPDSKVCERYFQISEQKIIKSLFNRKVKTGKVLTAGDQMTANDQKTLEAGKQLYNSNRIKRSYIKLFIRELIWFFGKWKTNELDSFLNGFKPDIVLFGMEGYIHFNRICRYAVKKTGAKAIGYFWDDNFTYKQMKNRIGFYVLRFFQRRSLKKLAKCCSAFWAISPKTKEEADAFFNIDSLLLTKPIHDQDKGHLTPHAINNPLQIVYTGNLLIGRWQTVCLVSKALDIINSSGIRAEFHIYTPTQLPNMLDEINHDFVFLHPPVSQADISLVQEKADILLFAEDIDGIYCKKARLSFSTKITDYLQYGKCIVAIGNEDTAPMQYLKDNEAALCITEKNRIVPELLNLIRDPQKINAYGENAYQCGMRNHSEEQILERLRTTVNSVLTK